VWSRASDAVSAIMPMLAIAPPANVRSMKPATKTPPSTAPHTEAIIRTSPEVTDRACRQMAPRNTVANDTMTAPHSDHLTWVACSAWKAPASPTTSVRAAASVAKMPAVTAMVPPTVRMSPSLVPQYVPSAGPGNNSTLWSMPLVYRRGRGMAVGRHLVYGVGDDQAGDHRQTREPARLGLARHRGGDDRRPPQLRERV